MRNAEAFEPKCVSHKMALPVTRFLGKMLMDEQTPPLPAHKEMFHSSLVAPRQEMWFVKAAGGGTDTGKRYRLQSSFLISAAAALQPPCASGPGAWERSAGSAHNPFKCFGDQQEAREQLQQEQHGSMSCSHVTQGMLRGFYPPQHPRDVTSLSNTSQQHLGVFLLPACHHPASWSGFHPCSWPEAQEILPGDVPPGSLDQKQQRSSQIISSADVVHARIATNIA